MKQQKQTLDYFKSHAEDWNQKATDEEYSLIENRHNAVLEVMKAYSNNSSILDVGCGTGQLAIEASKIGWQSLGLDFSQEMIDICIINNTHMIENLKDAGKRIGVFPIDDEAWIDIGEWTEYQKAIDKF
jgi:SAM-dependent methyltransferase